MQTDKMIQDFLRGGGKIRILKASRKRVKTFQNNRGSVGYRGHLASALRDNFHLAKSN